MKYLVFLAIFLFLACQSKNSPDIKKDSVSSYFEAIQTNDVPLETPKKGEWLFDHKEPGQTYGEYIYSFPVRLSRNSKIIYLQPIGEFTHIQDSLLNSLADYVYLFFRQMVGLSQAVPDSSIPRFARRIREKGSEQILAPYILDSMLKGKIPVGGIVLMGVSEKDLYPSPEWNYVFGLASYADRVGVSSIYRLENGKLDATNYTICLSRLINVCTHEIGHMFSLHHCTHAKCVMNGSNSLSETDSEPNRMCSECQRKLYWNLNYDNNKRLKALSDYFKRNILTKDYQLAMLDEAKIAAH